MLSKIKYKIPSQGFELVRDQIAAILLIELTNQVVAFGDYDVDVTVWAERTNSFDKTEIPAINVSLDNGQFSNKSVNSVDGTYIYNIDAYTNAASNDDTGGDVLAKIKLQHLLGICRAILEDENYGTLGFVAPFISNVHYEQLNIREQPIAKEDGLNTMMGRLTFSVRLVETTQLPVGSLIHGNDTQVLIDTSNQGYQFTINP